MVDLVLSTVSLHPSISDPTGQQTSLGFLANAFGWSWTARSPVSTPRIMVLTPLAPKSLPDVFPFFEMLCGLSYPKDKMDLGFLLPVEMEAPVRDILNGGSCRRGKHGTRTASSAAFRKVHLIIEPPPPPMEEEEQRAIEADRHSLHGQEARRSQMARARNLLLTTMLGRVEDAEWVLHLDVDVVSLTTRQESTEPVPFVENLFEYGRTGVRGAPLGPEEAAADIVAPNLLATKANDTALWVFDWNNWSETVRSRRFKNRLRKDKVLFEGM